MRGVVQPTTFAVLQVVNRDRSAQWHKEGTPWTLADWSNALCGEAGELANIIKKIRRIQTNTHARYSEQDLEALRHQAAMEVADVFLYLDLLCEQLGIDMLDYIALKFNHTSHEHGFPHRLEIES